MNLNEIEKNNNKNSEKKLTLTKCLLFAIMGGVLLYVFFTLYYKDTGFGTCFFSFIIPFIPLQLYFFVNAVIKIANKQRRTVFDYAAFGIISVAIMISSWAFAASDSGMPTDYVPPSLYYIYEPAYIISILFIVIILIKERDKKVK